MEDFYGIHTLQLDAHMRDVQKQFDNNPHSYDDYLSTCKENFNEKLDAIEKYNVRTKKYLHYLIFILITLLILMSLSILHMIILFKT